MKPHLSHPEFTAQETQFIQRLRRQPQRLARLQSILDLAHAADGPLKKTGTAWLPDHADQPAHLRVLRANDQWPSFWN